MFSLFSMRKENRLSSGPVRRKRLPSLPFSFTSFPFLFTKFGQQGRPSPTEPVPNLLPVVLRHQETTFPFFFRQTPALSPPSFDANSTNRPSLCHRTMSSFFHTRFRIPFSLPAGHFTSTAYLFFLAELRRPIVLTNDATPPLRVFL